MKLANIPYVRADAVDAALNNFLAKNDLRPCPFGKTRLRNLARWFQWRNEIENDRYNMYNLPPRPPLQPSEQNLMLEWSGSDGQSYCTNRMWANLADLERKELQPLARNIIRSSHSFRMRIYDRAGPCKYFRWNL